MVEIAMKGLSRVWNGWSYLLKRVEAYAENFDGRGGR